MISRRERRFNVTTPQYNNNNPTTMKKTISNILALLLIVAVCAGLVWLIPAKAMIAVLLLVQLLTLIILGTLLKQLNDGKE